MVASLTAAAVRRGLLGAGNFTPPAPPFNRSTATRQLLEHVESADDDKQALARFKRIIASLDLHRPPAERVLGIDQPGLRNLVESLREPSLSSQVASLRSTIAANGRSIAALRRQSSRSAAPVPTSARGIRDLLHGRR